MPFGIDEGNQRCPLVRMKEIRSEMPSGKDEGDQRCPLVRMKEIRDALWL